MPSDHFTLVLGNKVYSSWSLRGWLVVRQAGITFDEIVVPLRQPETRPTILKYSPSGKVPALNGPDGPVWDSLAIAEYLAERVPAAGLWPADRAARAVARSICAEMHAGFAALRSAWPMNLRRYRRPSSPSDDVAADIARILAVWRDCRARYGSDGPYLFGRWSAADAFYAPVVSRFLSYDADLDDIGKAYVEAVFEHEWMRQWRAAAAEETWTVPGIDAA